MRCTRERPLRHAPLTLALVAMAALAGCVDVEDADPYDPDRDPADDERQGQEPGPDLTPPAGGDEGHFGRETAPQDDTYFERRPPPRVGT